MEYVIWQYFFNINNEIKSEISKGGLGLPLTGVSTIWGSTPAGITLRFPAGGFPCPAEYPRQ